MELQLRHCIHGQEHRLDEMNLISESGTVATKPSSTEDPGFWRSHHASHPTRPQAKLENDTRTYSSLH